MISFFPRLYPDEILFSVIARYHKYSGNLVITDSIRDLFGVNRVNATVAFTKGIGHLANQIKHMGISFDDLLMNHTFFPIYTVFQSQEMVDKTVEWARFDSMFNPSATLGITYQEATQIARMRFCPQCLIQEKKDFGEGYWHRIHQLPGVSVCEKHACVLSDGDVHINGVKRNQFICIEDVCVFSELHISSLNQDEFDIAVRVSQNYEWLMKNYNFAREQYLRDNEFKKTYLYCLKQKGYTTKNYCVRTKAFIADFQNYFGRLLRVWSVEFDSESPNAWPIKMYRDDITKRNSILRHILYSIFLSGGLFQTVANCANESFCERKAIVYSPPMQFESKMESYRSTWLKLIRNNPGFSVTKLNELNQPVYIWLLRHDKEWLQRITPYSSNRKHSIKTRDWSSFDKELEIAIQTAVNAMKRSESRPERITKAKIARAIGYYYYMSNKRNVLSRLPLTTKCLDDLVETRDEYRKRKIMWALEALQEGNVEISKYRLMRKAGIPDRMTAEYWNFIEEKVLEYRKK